MKNIELVELTLEQLDGEPPVAGSELLIDGGRYLIREGKRPKTRSSKWRRKTASESDQKWQVLVEKLDK